MNNKHTKTIVLFLSSIYIAPIVGQTNNIGAITAPDISTANINITNNKPSDVKTTTKKVTTENQFINYATGVKFKSNRDIFQVMPGVFAASKQSLSNNKNTLTATVNHNKIIGSKGTMQIFVRDNGLLNKTQSAENTKTVMATIKPASGEKMVAYNTRTKNTGIIMGTIIVKYVNSNDLTDLEKLYGIKLINKFDSIKYAFFTTKDLIHIFSIADKLQKDARTQSAEVEVLENINVLY